MKYLKIFESFDKQGHFNDLSSELEEEFPNLVCKVDKDSIQILDKNDLLFDDGVIDLLIHRLELLQDKFIDFKLAFNCYYSFKGYENPRINFIVYYGLEQFIKKSKNKSFASILIVF